MNILKAFLAIRELEGTPRFGNSINVARALLFQSIATTPSSAEVQWFPLGIYHWYLLGNVCGLVKLEAEFCLDLSDLQLLEQWCHLLMSSILLLMVSLESGILDGLFFNSFFHHDIRYLQSRWLASVSSIVCDNSSMLRCCEDRYANEYKVEIS